MNICKYKDDFELKKSILIIYKKGNSLTSIRVFSLHFFYFKLEKNYLKNIN